MDNVIVIVLECCYRHGGLRTLSSWTMSLSWWMKDVVVMDNIIAMVLEGRCCQGQRHRHGVRRT